MGVLLERLNGFVFQFEILEQNQIGFRKGYETSDHIFTLRAITENYFRNNKGPLYVCFVDAKKAFNSVDRKLQLVTHGVKGNFLKSSRYFMSKINPVQGVITVWIFSLAVEKYDKCAFLVLSSLHYI